MSSVAPWLASGLDVAGRLAVAAAFGWAAAAKLADLAPVRATLYLSRLTRPWVPQLTVGLPAVELLLAAALLGARAGWYAAGAAALLLLAFVGYLALDRSSAQGCACFGGRITTSRRASIVRDLLLLAALAPGLARGPAASRAGVPASAEPPAAIAALLLAAALVGWAFRRDASRRRQPGSRASGRRRAGVPPAERSVAARPAAPFDVLALDGTRLRLVDLATRPGGVVLVFVEPGCVQCESLVPALEDRPDVVVLAAVVDPAEVAGWAERHGLPPSRVAADVDGTLADAYQVPGTPAAVRVDATGLLVDATGTPTSSPAVGLEAVTALAARRRG